MLSSIRSRLTYANVMATVAVFIALGGTSAAAVSLSKNSVGSSQIRNGSVTGKDVKNSSLTTSDVRDRSLLARDFKAGQLPRGATGATGATGSIGPVGAAGPSRTFEKRRTGSDFPQITSADPTAPTPIASLTGLPAGSYVITARLGANAAGIANTRLICSAAAGGRSQEAIETVGNGNGAVGQSILSASFTADVAAGGDATLSCYRESTVGNVFASEVSLLATQVGQVSRQ